MRHKDYVPNERTAIVIAEAVLVAQYGEDSVNKQKPLKAELKENKMWLVQGTIKKPEMIGGNSELLTCPKKFNNFGLL